MMRKSLFLTLFLLLFILLSCGNIKINNNDKKYSSISDSLSINLEQIYSTGAIPGFSVAVVNRDGAIYNEGYGKTDLNEESVYSVNTSQKIASISKTVLGIALLKAQEIGKLNISDPVDKYLPYKLRNPKHPDKPILIKHLAYHSSSLRDTRNIFENSYILTKNELDENEGALPFFQKSDSLVSLERFLANSLSKGGKWYSEESFFDFEPGTERRYSNLGAGICEYIIESVTKQDYASFVEQHIFSPLEMENSVWEIEKANNSSRLFLNDTTLIAQYIGFNKADGSLITSVKDMSLFLAELIKGFNGNGALLGKDSYDTYFDMQQYPEQNSQYGLFIELRPRTFGFKENLIGHMGADPGLLAAMYFSPKNGLGKIMFINIEPRTKEIRDEINEIWNELIQFEDKLIELKASS